MKILAIGDFHGKFPEKLKRKIRKINPDVILCTGDYAGIDDFRPWLKKVFKTREKGIEITLEKLIGKKRFKRLLKKDYAAGKAVIKRLNNLGIKAFSVFGNGDWYKAFFNRSNMDYNKLIKKLRYIKDINRGKTNFNGLTIAGFGGYLDIDVYFTEKGRKAIANSKENNRKMKKRYEKEEKRFINLMKSKPDILLSHYTPYGCLDRMKKSDLALSGSSMGISYFNMGIKKYKPILAFCGHMHENQGQCRIGRTLIVNPGAVSEGKAAVIEIDEERKKVKSVRFIK